MIEVEPHIAATIAAIPSYELPALAAQLLQRVKALDGTDCINSMFEVVAKHWVDPWSPPT